MEVVLQEFSLPLLVVELWSQVVGVDLPQCHATARSQEARDTNSCARAVLRKGRNLEGHLEARVTEATHVAETAVSASKI